jgi:hypothetical protein
VPSAGGTLVVAVGLWVDNSLMLMPWPSSSSTPQQQQQLQIGCVMELQEEQARSVALLPVGGNDVLLAGTNSGSVLMWQLEQEQQQQQQGCSSWQLRHGRVVRISSTSVSLLPMQLPAAADAADDLPSSGSCSSSGGDVASVYAHAGAGAIIRPVPSLVAARQQQQQAQQQGSSSSSSSKAMLTATDCLLVSRVCGSEACLSAAPVASADMPPHSLAWVSPSNKLCFGELDPLHKLRWRAAGLPGTPLALALHQDTNTLLLLMQTEGSRGVPPPQQQQQQLVVLDARSLSVLLVLGLAEGHAYTCLAVLHLPCTSQQQQQGHGAAAAGDAASAAGGQTSSSNGSSRAGLRPFIVLGSCLNMAVSPSHQAGKNAAGPSTSAASSTAAAGGLPEELQVGMLSFFELKATVTGPGPAAGASAAAPGSSAQCEMRYELLLHGMTPLPVTPACVCTVVPEVLREQSIAEQAAAAAGTTSGKGGGVQPVAAEAASTAAAALEQQGPVCLAVGSEAGVSLLQVVVDDAGRAEQQAVQQQLAAAAEVSLVDSWDLPYLL